MAVAKEEILEAIANMTVMEVVELISAMEEKFGVSAAAAVAQIAAPTAEASAPAEVQTEFTVNLTSFGEKKVQVIKVVRAITGLGLKEAKALVEGIPSPIKEGIPKDEAEKIQKDIEAAGGSVEIK
ncbi:MAG: 50S ribosomal protein L7/L12 [Gammaproteobacteria bacterium]|nr:MAG: 50S ribosomal protein L7/L12 [Gammaproteobacteria bacterium]